MLGPETPDWADLSADGRAELIKSNPRRKIWRVHLGELEVFVKRFEPGGLISWLKCLFRSSPAAVEFENHRRAGAAGISCPEALAFAHKGSRATAGPSILITAAVSPAQPLDVYLREHPLDDGLVNLMARFLAQAHRAGLAHPDPHLGNFLLKVDTEGRRQLILTDLQKFRRTTATSKNLDREAKRNLACCYAVISYHTSLQQRQKFLADYLTALAPESIPAATDLRELYARIERTAARQSLRHWAKRDRRPRRSNRYFARIRLPDRWKGSVLLQCKEPRSGSTASVSDFTAEQWRTTLSDPLSLFAGPNVQTVKDSASSLVVRRRLRVGEILLEVYCKLARPRPKAISQLKSFWAGLRASRTQRAYETGFALLNRHMPTVLPLAWLAKQIGPYRRWAVLITEAVPEAVNLEHFFTTECDPSGSFQDYCLLKDLAATTAALAASLISHGFIHRDFQPRNILIQRSSDGRRRLLLSDCETIKHVGWITTRQRLRLPMRMQLATEIWPGLSRTIRLRFLLSYLLAIGVPQDKWKCYWRRTYAWAKKKRA